MTEHLEKIVTWLEAKANVSAAQSSTTLNIPNIIAPPPGSSAECQLCYLNAAAVYLAMVDWCIQFAPDPQHCIEVVHDYYLDQLGECPCGQA